MRICKGFVSVLNFVSKKAVLFFGRLRMTAIGVPIKILHEAEGHIVTLETTIGEVYRGKLNEVIFSLEFSHFFKTFQVLHLF